MSVAGRTAVITGGGRGIGRAICLELARQGANIVVNDIAEDEQALQTAKDCQDLGVQAIVVAGDVSKAEDCKKVVDKTTETFGSLDILVNNAGITRDGLIMRMSEADFDDVIRINLKGTFLFMKQVARLMMKQRHGRIISISSVVGVHGNAGQVNYSASKAGIIGMTKSLAKELGTRNVTANAIAPGFIQTKMTDVLPEKAKEEMIKSIPVGRMGQPEDIAHAVAFFAQDESSYITGQVLGVDGGMGM
jgi:3-oxoacyl-[acyl-carrier protein] reductase